MRTDNQEKIFIQSVKNIFISKKIPAEKLQIVLDYVNKKIIQAYKIGVHSYTSSESMTGGEEKQLSEMVLSGLKDVLKYDTIDYIEIIFDFEHLETEKRSIRYTLNGEKLYYLITN